MGQILIIVGFVIVAIGVLVWLGVPIGRLPGDILIRRDNFTFYLPITTSILAIVALILIGMLLRR